MIPSSGTELEIRVGDIEVSYNDVGDKNSQAIIFIHGFPFDKNMWNPQLEELGKHFRCIAYDLSGYGHTTARKHFSIEQFADDLDRFMHLMQIEKAAICGLSMGGYIALRAVAKYPERFSHLMLCNTQCIADSEEGRQKRFNTIRQIESEGLNLFAENFVKNIFTEKSQEQKKEIVTAIRSTILNSEPDSITGTLKALAERTETCSLLSAIHVPVLIICGREDKITPLAQSEFLHSNIHGSQLAVIDDASHVSNLEQPQVFNSAIMKFLSAGK